MNLFKAAFIHYPGPAFLGRLFQTRLYHLGGVPVYCHSRLREHVLCKPLDSSLRWNDDGGRIGFVTIPTVPLLFLTNDLTSAPAVIYGHEVLYAARGQEARSRPAKAGIQWVKQVIPALRE